MILGRRFKVKTPKYFIILKSTYQNDVYYSFLIFWSLSNPESEIDDSKISFNFHYSSLDYTFSYAIGWCQHTGRNGSVQTTPDNINIQMLSYFGHITRRKGNNLEKIIMQGMIEGKRRKGRSRSRWFDQISSAAELPLRDCYVLAGDCHLWRCIYEVTSCQLWQEQTNQIGWMCTPLYTVFCMIYRVWFRACLW